MFTGQINGKAVGNFARGGRWVAGWVSVVCLVFMSSCTANMDTRFVTETREAVTGADAFMGDWQGHWMCDCGVKLSLSAQVIALGKGKYQANLLSNEGSAVLEGSATDGKAQFSGVCETGKSTWYGSIEGVGGQAPCRGDCAV